MLFNPPSVKLYRVFLASPGDVNIERQHVRRFFEDFNRSTASLWNARFEVIDWENYSTTGVGRPQELITQQTLERYKDSLALVIGIMGQRFGTPSGNAESGTEEEFNWAMESNKVTSFPEIKWFFRKTDKVCVPPDPDEADKALYQWKRVFAFRKRMQDPNDPVFYTEYPDADGFSKVFDRDLQMWLTDSARPWVAPPPARVAADPVTQSHDATARSYSMKDCIGLWHAEIDGDRVEIDLDEEGSWNAICPNKGILHRFSIRYTGDWSVKDQYLRITQKKFEIVGWPAGLREGAYTWLEGRIREITAKEIVLEDGTTLAAV